MDSVCLSSRAEAGPRALAWRLRMALVEHAALCRLVAGGKANALQEIARAAALLRQAPTREYTLHTTTTSRLAA